MKMLNLQCEIIKKNDDEDMKDVVSDDQNQRGSTEQNTETSQSNVFGSIYIGINGFYIVKYVINV